jgi:hypothetical protein
MTNLESEYRVFFSRARKPETLLIMVKGQARRHRLFFDETVTGYARSSRRYKELGDQRGAALFAAAHERLQRLIEKGARVNPDSLVG